MQYTRFLISKTIAVFVGLGFGLLILTLPATATQQPESELVVVALFNKAAIVKYQGKQKMLREGQRLNASISLIKANSQQAVFQIDGKEVVKKLGSGSQFSATGSKSTAQKTVRIVRDRSGMFRVAGSINGMPIRFLVDTGATSIAMSEQVARQLGLQYQVYGQPMQSSTAGGIVQAWGVVLENVKVGGTISLNNVKAAVIRGYPSNEVLLGNNFLSQLKIQHSGDLMILSTHY